MNKNKFYKKSVKWMAKFEYALHTHCTTNNWIIFTADKCHYPTIKINYNDGKPLVILTSPPHLLNIKLTTGEMEFKHPDTGIWIKQMVSYDQSLHLEDTIPF